MTIKPKDYRNFNQDDVTKGNLEAELTIKFKLRPAGWSGNDKSRLFAVQTILNLIISIFEFTSILNLDESVSYSARWKRPDDGIGENSWTGIELKKD